MTTQNDIPDVEQLQIEKDDIVCTLPCPHGQKSPNDFVCYEREDIRVGSDMCLSCEFCANKHHQPTADGIILCAYLYETERRRLSTLRTAYGNSCRSKSFLMAYNNYVEEHGEIDKEDFFYDIYEPERRAKAESKNRK